MEFVIKPYESAGPIKIGMTKEEVRSFMPEAPEDDHYFCEPPIAILEGKPINGVPFIEAKNWLENFDSELEEERFVGVTSFKLGVGLYAPNYYDDEDPTIPVEAVIVFKKGYYDNIR